jgi:hypothetical protein
MTAELQRSRSSAAILKAGIYVGKAALSDVMKLTADLI